MKPLIRSLFVLFIFPIAFTLSSSNAGAQVQTARYVSVVNNSHGFYEYLPQGYSTGSSTYPLMIFCHGLGELGDGSASQLPKILNQGLPKLINQGKFPTSFTVNGQTFSFIVISPQFVAWPTNADVNNIIDYAVAHYRVNPNRIYVTGLSMGGGATWGIAATVPMNSKIAGIVPIAGALYPIAARWNAIADANIAVWATHNDGDPTVTVSYTTGFINGILARNPAAHAKMTIFHASGHDAWTHTYDPTFTENGLNIYQWLLQYQKSGTVNQPPVVNAGTDVTITLPTSSATAKATATDVGGSIAKYAWTKVAGPTAYTISNAAILNPVFSGLTAGVYTFRLTVTDNLGAVTSDDMNITVNAAASGLPVANAGTDHSITLPTNSVSLTGSGSEVGGTISSWLWTKIAGPTTGTVTTSTSASTTATGLAAGVYSFELKITDSKGVIDRDTAKVTVSPAVLSGTSKSVRVQIYGGTFPYNNTKWNNWNVVTAVGTAASTNINSGAFKYDDGTASTISANLSHSQAVKDNGATYGSGMAPAEVLRMTSYSSLDRTLTISGLVPGKAYSMEFYSSRASSGNSTIFTIGAVSVTINSYNDFTNKALFTNLVANAQGQIIITIKKVATFDYINGFTLTESGTGTTPMATALNASTFEAQTNETDLSASTGFSIYPNPVSDQFVLQLNNTARGAMVVRIVNMTGQVQKEFRAVKDQDIISNTYTLGQEINRGTYIVQVKVGNWTAVRKIVKL
jgi:dienelactone hydrolase